MMEEHLRSLYTELWHPYSRPEGAHGGQGTTHVEDYLTDTPHIARLDRVTDGL